MLKIKYSQLPPPTPAQNNVGKEAGQSGPIPKYSDKTQRGDEQVKNRRLQLFKKKR